MDRHWSDGVEWWRKPNTCYAKGLADGARMGYEQAYREIFETFRDQIGANLRGTTFREAMEAQIRGIETEARRRAWDATAALPRAGDRVVST